MRAGSGSYRGPLLLVSESAAPSDAQPRKPRPATRRASGGTRHCRDQLVRPINPPGGGEGLMQM